MRQLVKGAVRGWVDDGAASMGAALAFYTLFALAPLLVVIIALAGFFVGRDAAQHAMMALLTQFSGDKAAAGVQGLLAATSTEGRSTFSAVVSTVLLVVGATTMFAELQSDLNRIWRYKPPRSGGFGRFVRARLSAFVLVAAVGALLLASVGASAFLAIAAQLWFPSHKAVLHLGELAVSILLLTGLFAMVYKLLPAAPIAWSDVWVGAAVTSALFWLGKILIALYLAHAAVGSNLGAAGAIVVLVAWVYYSAQVFFLGAEFTREYALRHGSQQAAAPRPEVVSAVS